jgi:hypothetical protein
MKIASRDRPSRRASRPGGPRGIAALAAIALPFALACGVGVQVAFDAQEDFARFRTWSWRESDAARIAAASGDTRALAMRASARIAEALERRGFVRDPRDPDFTVAFDLSLEPRMEKVAVPSAPYFLSSNDSSPSYWIEGTDVVERRVEHFSLQMDIALPDGSVIWKGLVQKRMEHAAPAPLDEAVEELLRRLPPPSTAPVPDEDPPRLALLRN